MVRLCYEVVWSSVFYTGVVVLWWCGVVVLCCCGVGRLIHSVGGDNTVLTYGNHYVTTCFSILLHFAVLVWCGYVMKLCGLVFSILVLLCCGGAVLWCCVVVVASPHTFSGRR
jgi:hypothetical protein